MPVSTVMYGPGKSRPITCRYGSIWIWRRPDFASSRRQADEGSVLAALHPVLEHLERHGAVVVRRLADRLAVAVLDPGLVRGRAVARQRQPHQPAGGLTRQLVTVEQHLAEHGLRLMLALLGGQTKPARAIAEVIARGAGALQIKPGQIVLRIGVAEIRGRVGEHFPRPLRIGLDLRIGNTVEVITPERDKGLGDDRGL